MQERNSGAGDGGGAPQGCERRQTAFLGILDKLHAV